MKFIEYLPIKLKIYFYITMKNRKYEFMKYIKYTAIQILENLYYYEIYRTYTYESRLSYIAEFSRLFFYAWKTLHSWISDKISDLNTPISDV